ncbi:exported hypothetical protein [Capnocytophaga canimorsus]|uniref:Type IX secretion system membrane protein PorP/SprF n=1 Tax=Capnocytophaga canimorsus TaxID=28188 RepID=A0A0B7IKW6_9FLAO|nr:exported hypothetical protein [Capnocytophaga canimorsus]
MKRSNRFVLILMLMFSVFGYSQQESQYTQYMYNTMQFNPGYTGSRGVGSLFGLYRTQWVGLDGAPKTSNLSFHTPIKNKNVGLGLSIHHETIGPQTDTNLMVDFSYTLNLENSKLAFGIKGTAGFFHIDYNKLRLQDSGDYIFTGGDNRIFLRMWGRDCTGTRTIGIWDCLFRRYWRRMFTLVMIVRFLYLRTRSIII